MQEQTDRDIALLLEALAHLDLTLTPPRPPWREASSTLEASCSRPS